MDPASIAAAGTLAGLLRDYGPWGLLAVSIAGNAYLLKRWAECFEARIADAKSLATALAEGAAANREVTVALASRTGIFEQLNGSITAGNTQAAVTAAEQTSAMRELARRVDDLARRRESAA